MKNTGITYTSAERSPVILPEMAELLGIAHLLERRGLDA